MKWHIQTRIVTTIKYLVFDCNFGDEQITVLEADSNTLSLIRSCRKLANLSLPIVDLIFSKKSCVCLMAKLAAFKCKAA